MLREPRRRHRRHRAGRRRRRRSSGAATTSTTSTSPTPTTPSSASSPSSSRSSPTRSRGRRHALPRQHPARPAAPGPRPVRRAALRGARLDEPLDRDRQGLAAGGDRRGRLPDRQRRRDPQADRRAEPRPRRARGDGRWARAWSSPSRASTAPRSSPTSGFFALPGFPLEDVRDPTGAGDSFAGGFLGYLDGHRRRRSTTPSLRRAMGYGTVLASFNVEEFGTERVARLTREEIDERFERAARDDPVRADPGTASSPQPPVQAGQRLNCDTGSPIRNSARRGDGHRAADRRTRRATASPPTAATR